MAENGETRGDAAGMLGYGPGDLLEMLALELCLVIPVVGIEVIVGELAFPKHG